MRRTAPNPAVRRLLSVLWRPLLIAAVLLAIAAAAAWNWLAVDLPSLDRLTDNMVVPSTKILARDGRLLYEISDPAGRHHTTVPLKELPVALRQATIATEDASFYSNPGVDAVGILRAIWINARGGEVLAGGSTITQQVARNMLLDPQERAERTLTRKLRESILAWRLARAYSKDEILALYLNQTYYSHLAYGVEAAAQTFFGKSARDLDLAESALLAGLPQAPSLYDPLLYPEAASTRQAVVLELMVRHGYLKPEEARLARAETLQYAATPFPIEAPHFVFYVWNVLERKYGPEVLNAGLNVITTLDLDLTRTAQAIARRRLGDLAARSAGERGAGQAPPANATDAALVALDPRTGQVLAMVGSPDYFDAAISGAINMALAPRQPGSALKPLAYAAAFSPELCQAGSAAPCPMTGASMILDVRTAFITREGFSYVPQNYDRAYHGPVSARAALAGSLNVPAVLTLQQVGLSNLLHLAGRMGLTTLSDADRFGLALALGGGEVRLLDLVGAYGVFANGGRRVEPVVILRVETASGEVLEQWREPHRERVLDERVAYLVTDILADNLARGATFGFNSVLQIGRPAAVKTGTTTDYRDNWTVGYTPELVAGVWVGNANNSPMVNLSGVAGAGPIWHDFMRAALAGKPGGSFSRPEGLVTAEVCVPSGLLPTALCPRTRSELFLAGTVPTLPDGLYQSFNIDSRTGLLASQSTPPEHISQRVYLVLPPEAQEWARLTGLPQPPAGTAGTAGTAEPGSQSELQIISPDANTIYQISPRLPLSSQQIPLRVAAAGPLQSLTYFLNGQLLGSVNAAPFELWWVLEPGRHSLTAEAVLAEGRRAASAPIEFTVLP
jgi:penicillin-binding protein 1C